MGKIYILDTTLRDGGYCINWEFGTHNIVSIHNSLNQAKIDIIECGYLSKNNSYSDGSTKYNSLKDIEKFLPVSENKYVIMINYGDIDINDIPDYDGNGINGIRVAFRKNEYCNALEFCKKVKKKGYNVYIQPMLSTSYTNAEFSDLVQKVKEIKPYAFYVVDSFGSMNTEDLSRLYYLSESELPYEIKIGFHAHNNMQMAFSNAQYLLNLHTKHDVIIDSSIMGMGRGAGNINTEILAEYLNRNYTATYFLKPIIYTIDNIINKYFSYSPWGYSLPNYLSAKYNLHPNYASYLCKKNTLSLDDIDEIFKNIVEEKKDTFDMDYINSLYLNYMEKEASVTDHINEFFNAIKNRNIFVIAPGPSSKAKKDQISLAIKKSNGIVISINHIYEYSHVDYVFFSNKKRYKNFCDKSNIKTIVTSNIFSENFYIKTDYMSLINNTEYVSDNAGLMIVKFLISLGVPKVYLCGYDGFSADTTNNYADENMMLNMDQYVANKLNDGMKKMLLEYMKQIDIHFVTSNLYFN